MDKRTLRRALRTQRRQLPTDVVRRAGEQVVEHLVRSPLLMNAPTIALYAAMRGEVPLDALLAHPGHTWVLPRVIPDSRELSWHPVVRMPPSVGAYGIREPAPDSPSIPVGRVDLWLIPAVAVDTTRMRLGQGGGFYDTLLGRITAPVVAVVHDFQLLPTVPVEPHDRPVDHVLTPSGWSHTR